MNRKKVKGSLTVEATLVLPLVIITLLFITNLLNIYMVHTCMQQALNNTAKKISQDVYMIYRFAGEKNYSKFIDELSKINSDYDETNGKATDVKNKLDDLQKSVKNTVLSINNTFHTFDDCVNEDKSINMKLLINKCPTFIDNIADMKDKFDTALDDSKKFSSSINELGSSLGKNMKSVVVKLLCDTVTGGVTYSLSKVLFDGYIKNLEVPSSKIDAKSVNFFNSSLNEDGSFTMVVSYLYQNPFSLINSKSAEYSVINKVIRLHNAITIKPFVGKNGTSLVEESDDESGGDSNGESDINEATISELEKDNDENVASNSEIKDEKHMLNIDSKYIYYHYNKNCSNCYVNMINAPYSYFYYKNIEIISENSTIVPVFTPNGVAIYSTPINNYGIYLPCPICVNINELTMDKQDEKYWFDLKHTEKIENKENIFFHKNKTCKALRNIIENEFISEGYRISKYKDKWENFSNPRVFNNKGYYSDGVVEEKDDGTSFVKIFIPCRECCEIKSDGHIDSNKTYYSDAHDIYGSE